MTDAGFVTAAYAVILGGLALYTVTLWRRLRGVQGFGMTFTRNRRAGGRDDEAR
jgi:hypothetical protein